MTFCQFCGYPTAWHAYWDQVDAGPVQCVYLRHVAAVIAPRHGKIATMRRVKSLTPRQPEAHNPALEPAGSREPPS